MNSVATMKGLILNMNTRTFSNTQPRLLIKSDLVAIIIFTVFATALAPFVDEAQRNSLVIGVSALMPLFLIAFSLPPKRDLFWVGTIILYIVSTSALRVTTSEISSIAFTILLFFPYLFIAACLSNGKIARQKIIVLLRRLILTFCVFSVAQFLAKSGGFQPPNEILSGGLWRNNSLAVEPSHLTRVLIVSLFVYLVLNRAGKDAAISPLRLLLSEWVVVSAFLTSMLLSGSALGALLTPFALILVFKVRWVILFTGLGTLLVPLAHQLEIEALQRALVFIAALHTMDIWELVNADHSGSVRVLPTLVYLNEIAPSTSGFWFGSGISEISHFLAGKLPGVPDEFEAGFFPGFAIAFGLVGFALVTFALVFRFLHPKTLPFILLWIALFFSSPWNTQLFWYGLMMLRILYHFEVETKGKGANQPHTKTDR